MSARQDDESPLNGGPPRRRYHSPQRAAAARQTRARIRAAAQELFLADGYAATSMRAVALAAGVAEKTVYLQFTGKSALLKEVVETAIVGDDEKVAAASRDWFLRAAKESDLDRKLDQLVYSTAELHERSGPVFAVARGAAAVDPEVAQLWSAGKFGHRQDMTLMAQSFDDADLLPDGTTAGWAMATLYTLLGPETWQLIRTELSFDAAGYRTWLLETLHAAFRHL